jgi:hypothetical protein
LSKTLLLIAIGNLEPLLRAACIPIKRLALHQLLPETAEDIAHAGMVVFLDASRKGKKVGWQKIEPDHESAALLHALSPAGVLAIAADLFHATPPAYLMTVPGEDFSHGEAMSRTTQGYVEEACAMWPMIVKAYQHHLGASG